MGDRFSHLTDPATGEVTARLALASLADVEAAVTVAKAAFAQWRDISPARRTEVVFRFRELLDARAAELAELITVEHGKVLSEARGEVARGQEAVEFACDIEYRLQGGATGNASTPVDVSSFRQPVGPVAIIAPSTFRPLWFLPITIAAGNTVVLKPSEKVPSAALWLARLWAEAGLPQGVFNVLHGDKIDRRGASAHAPRHQGRDGGGLHRFQNEVAFSVIAQPNP